jgi:hypothetical protein
MLTRVSTVYMLLLFAGIEEDIFLALNIYEKRGQSVLIPRLVRIMIIDFLA